jgi:hypothetical protein
MTEYALRSMADEELDALVLRLEAQVRGKRRRDGTARKDYERSPRSMSTSMAPYRAGPSNTSNKYSASTTAVRKPSAKSRLRTTIRKFMLVGGALTQSSFQGRLRDGSQQSSLSIRRLRAPLAGGAPWVRASLRLSPATEEEIARLWANCVRYRGPMNEYTLRSLCDEELEDLLQRLETQVRCMSQATTSLGKKLAEQYLAALTAARLEAQRRRDD